MTDQCQCDWHKLQYCWQCEADFTDHYYNDPDKEHKAHKEDAAYFAHLADAADAPPLTELAETIRQEASDYMTELSRRLEIGQAPVVIASF